MDFRELFRTVAKRQRMMLLDDRYATLVAFVQGCDAATEGTLLNGFHQWVAERIVGGPSSLHWSAIVAESHGPDAAEPEIAQHLLRLLDTFLATRPDSGRPPTPPPRASA